MSKMHGSTLDNLRKVLAFVDAGKEVPFFPYVNAYPHGRQWRRVFRVGDFRKILPPGETEDVEFVRAYADAGRALLKARDAL